MCVCGGVGGGNLMPVHQSQGEDKEREHFRARWKQVGKSGKFVGGAEAGSEAGKCWTCEDEGLDRGG